MKVNSHCDLCLLQFLVHFYPLLTKKARIFKVHTLVIFYYGLDWFVQLLSAEKRWPRWLIVKFRGENAMLAMLVFQKVASISCTQSSVPVKIKYLDKSDHHDFPERALLIESTELNRVSCRHSKHYCKYSSQPENLVKATTFDLSLA